MVSEFNPRWVTCWVCGGYGARKRTDGKRWCVPCYNKNALTVLNARRSDERAIIMSNTAKDRQRSPINIDKKYGISVLDYERMYDGQEGRCAICRDLPPPGRPLNIDHDHDTGRVRALLCTTCNQGLGFMRDDPELLEVASAYLLGHGRPRGKRTVGSVTTWKNGVSPGRT